MRISPDDLLRNYRTDRNRHSRIRHQRSYPKGRCLLCTLVHRSCSILTREKLIRKPQVYPITCGLPIGTYSLIELRDQAIMHYCLRLILIQILLRVYRLAMLVEDFEVEMRPCGYTSRAYLPYLLSLSDRVSDFYSPCV